MLLERQLFLKRGDFTADAFLLLEVALKVTEDLGTILRDQLGGLAVISAMELIFFLGAANHGSNLRRARTLTSVRFYRVRYAEKRLLAHSILQ